MFLKVLCDESASKNPLKAFITGGALAGHRNGHCRILSSIPFDILTSRKIPTKTLNWHISSIWQILPCPDFMPVWNYSVRVPQRSHQDWELSDFLLSNFRYWHNNSASGSRHIPFSRNHKICRYFTWDKIQAVSAFKSRLRLWIRKITSLPSACFSFLHSSQRSRFLRSFSQSYAQFRVIFNPYG